MPGDPYKGDIGAVRKAATWLIGAVGGVGGALVGTETVDRLHSGLSDLHLALASAAILVAAFFVVFVLLSAATVLRPRFAAVSDIVKYRIEKEQRYIDKGGRRTPPLNVLAPELAAVEANSQVFEGRQGGINGIAEALRKTEEAKARVDSGALSGATWHDRTPTAADRPEIEGEMQRLRPITDRIVAATNYYSAEKSFNSLIKRLMVSTVAVVICLAVFLAVT